MSNLHKEIHLETEICEYLPLKDWHYAVGDVVAYEQARALISAAVTGKIDVRNQVSTTESAA